MQGPTRIKRTMKDTTAERWFNLLPPTLFRARGVTPLLEAYKFALTNTRLIYVYASTFPLYTKYLEEVGLEQQDFRYVMRPSNVRGANPIVIRTGMFWDRADRDEMDRRLHSLQALVYDDWPPALEGFLSSKEARA